MILIIKTMVVVVVLLFIMTASEVKMEDTGGLLVYEYHLWHIFSAVGEKQIAEVSLMTVTMAMAWLTLFPAAEAETEFTMESLTAKTL